MNPDNPTFRTPEEEKRAEEYARLKKQIDDMHESRNNSFAKIVERTSKLDAYEQVLSWSKSDRIQKRDILYFLNAKIEGHREWVNSLPVEYCYGDQTLKVKKLDSPDLVRADGEGDVRS